MKLERMNKIPDEDMGTEFHSVCYTAIHYSQFIHWCEQHCRGEWGTEEKPAYDRTFIGDASVYFGWLYDDQDAMLFKLAFA